MCKEFEEKLRRSFGGQVRVNPEGDLEDGEVFVIMRFPRALKEILIVRKAKGGNEELCCFGIIKDWQKWDELIALIKSAVRLYREGE